MGRSSQPSNPIYICVTETIPKALYRNTWNGVKIYTRIRENVKYIVCSEEEYLDAIKDTARKRKHRLAKAYHKGTLMLSSTCFNTLSKDKEQWRPEEFAWSKTSKPIRVDKEHPDEKSLPTNNSTDQGIESALEVVEELKSRNADSTDQGIESALEVVEDLKSRNADSTDQGIESALGVVEDLDSRNAVGFEILRKFLKSIVVVHEPENAASSINADV